MTKTSLQWALHYWPPHPCSCMGGRSWLATAPSWLVPTSLIWGQLTAVTRVPIVTAYVSLVTLVTPICLVHGNTDYMATGGTVR